MKWIDYMNIMFAANCYTDHGRVTVLIVDACTVRVTVLSQSVDIDIDGLTDYGIMMIIMSQVDRLYGEEDACMIKLDPVYSEYVN